MINDLKFGFVAGIDEIKPGETGTQAIERVFREKKRLHELAVRDSKQNLNYNNDVIPSS